MKNKVVSLIKILGIGLHEIIIDLEIGIYLYNSIEWSESENKIYLHIFEDYDLDIAFDFDDLSNDDKLIIYNLLSRIVYN